MHVSYGIQILRELYDFRLCQCRNYDFEDDIPITGLFDNVNVLLIFHNGCVKMYKGEIAKNKNDSLHFRLIWVKTLQLLP